MANVATPSRDPTDPGGSDAELSAWSDGLLLAVAVGYGLFIGLLSLLRGVPLTPDVLVVLAGFAVVFLWRLRVPLLREWIPFLVLFLAYELMRGLADNAGLPVHVGDVASIERALFGGHLPTAVLQGWLRPSGGADALAVVGTVAYLMHFVLPVITGLILWRFRHRLFHPYLVSLVLLSFAGFVTYLLLPVAPPWMAARLGAIGSYPGEAMVTYLKPDAFARLAGALGLDGPGLYDVAFRSLNANPVAAFPSLHAAYPFLSFLVLRHAFGRIAWLAFAYFGLVAVTIVYTADHYVVDVVGGMTYALGAYAAMWWLARRRDARQAVGVGAA
jgi:hypothetical protein